MAGAVARWAKWLTSTPIGVVNLISWTSIPVLGYILVQQEKEFALLEQKKRQQRSFFDALRARGTVRGQ